MRVCASASSERRFYAACAEAARLAAVRAAAAVAAHDATAARLIVALKPLSRVRRIHQLPHSVQRSRVVHRVLVYPLHRDADASERRRVRGREGNPVVHVDDVAEHAVCAAEVVLTAMLSGQRG